MAVNKVTLGNQTIIDLTGDTISAGDALVGVSLHLATGEAVTGTLSDFTGADGQNPGTHGLVPAPAAGDQDKVLKGDGTWGAIPDMTGANSSDAGTHGLVPAPGSVTLPQLHYLSANGTFRAPVATRSMITSGDIVYEQFSTISATSATETGGRLYTARKVLWENSSPSSSFGAQTITLSDAVDGFLFWTIEFYLSTSVQDKVAPFVIVGKTGIRASFAGSSSNSNRGNSRDVEIDSTGKQLTISANYYNNTQTNANMIPYRVYGFFKL